MSFEPGDVVVPNHPDDSRFGKRAMVKVAYYPPIQYLVEFFDTNKRVTYNQDDLRLADEPQKGKR